MIYSPEASPAWLSLGRSWHEDGWGGARVPGWHREGCLGLQGWGLAGGMAAGEGGESWLSPSARPPAERVLAGDETRRTAPEGPAAHPPVKGVLPFRRLESSGRTCSGTKSREEVRGAGGADGFPGSPGERRVARVSLPFGGRQEALEVAHHPWGLPGTGRHLHTPLWGRDCRTQHCRATQREPTALRENRLGERF